MLLRARVSPLPIPMRPGENTYPKSFPCCEVQLLTIVFRVMEIIGKGDYEKGSVWVARKIPDGYVCAHANQARITTFPLNDPENCVYSPDVISFARDIGLYPASANDEDFSFSDVYDAVTFSGARFCEARVWSFFGDIMGKEWADQYEDYAMGYNLTNRMPLWVKVCSQMLDAHYIHPYHLCVNIVLALLHS
jgi:dipeptidase